MTIQRKNSWIAAVPATFITIAALTYILNAQIGFGLSLDTAYIGGAIITGLAIISFFWGLSRKFSADENGKKPIILDDGLGKAPAQQ
ncbi:hypothetical protein [Indiicoccus explosivorum]|uniref:hypothetical protein n=1 Tax=Indiicoccus explosivorum TaxID=1917864 RepID=UPI000B44F8D1|nr:hypothetical protein [Indiicoccus explosivorum]